MIQLFQQNLYNSEYSVKISSELLQDINLMSFLSQFFKKPEELLTYDCNEISERNCIISELFKNKNLYAKLENFYQQLNEISQTYNNYGNEPRNIFSRLNNMHSIYITIQSILCEIQMLSTEELSHFLKKLCSNLKNLLNILYSENFIEKWDTCAKGAEKQSSFLLQIDFLLNGKINTVALTNISELTYEKPFLLSSSYSKNSDVYSYLSLRANDHSEWKQMRDWYRKPEHLKSFSKSLQKLQFMQTQQLQTQLLDFEKNLIHLTYKFRIDFEFVSGAIKYMTVTKNTCFANIEPLDAHMISVNEMIHPALITATNKSNNQIISNDIFLKKNKEIALIGGINCGGKTTFLSSIASIQVLFQLGLPIPATNARISPVTKIFSAFSKIESENLGQGKLEQELINLKEVVENIDEYGLFFCNEAVSSTSPMESYLISKHVLCVLKAKKARGIWVTHLFPLFNDINEINQLPFGSQIFGMCTTSNRCDSTFKIIEGVPKFHSGASDFLHNFKFE